MALVGKLGAWLLLRKQTCFPRQSIRKIFDWVEPTNPQHEHSIKIWKNQIATNPMFWTAFSSILWGKYSAYDLAWMKCVNHQGWHCLQVETSNGAKSKKLPRWWERDVRRNSYDFTFKLIIKLTHNSFSETGINLCADVWKAGKQNEGSQRQKISAITTKAYNKWYHHQQGCDWEWISVIWQ